MNKYDIQLKGEKKALNIYIIRDFAYDETSCNVHIWNMSQPRNQRQRDTHQQVNKVCYKHSS